MFIATDSLQKENQYRVKEMTRVKWREDMIFSTFVLLTGISIL